MPTNIMFRANIDTKKLEYSTNEGTSWSEFDITGMTLVPSNADVTKVDGVALGTHAAGYVPDDIRRIDGVALSTHGAGYFPSDGRQWNGSAIATPNVAGYPLADTHYHRGTAENVLISGRRDVNAQVVGDKSNYTLTAGSYSVRASNTQETATAAASATSDVTISSVTLARVVDDGQAATQNSSGASTLNVRHNTVQVVSSTVHRYAVQTLANNHQASGRVSEFF